MACKCLQALSILFLASMRMPTPVAGSPEESGYRFDLIHVTHKSPALSGSLSILPAKDSTVKYLMEVKMGTQQETTFLGVADTGSELVWTNKMKMCTGSPSFTATSEPCSDYCVGKHCNSCILNRTYGSGDTGMKGFVGKEVLTLPTGGTDNYKKKVDLVCAIEWSDGMLPASASAQGIVAEGIVGLSRGPLSLVNQLGVTKFSYCLSNPFVEPKLRSPLWFGRGLEEAGWRSTPLVEIITPEPQHLHHSRVSPSPSANRYYIQLDQICVQGRCKQLDKEYFRFKGQDKGLMFVDSGCTYTHLDTKIFAELKDLLFQVLKIKVVRRKDEWDCFETPPPTMSQPDMILKFTDAYMHLPWANYVSKVDEGFCLTIYDSDKSILGNMQQQNLYMHYDLTQGKEELSFKRVDDCSKR